MAKVIDLLSSEYLKLLVYGSPGAGKTGFLGSAAVDPRTAPVLHVDCSGNPVSLLRHKKQGKVIRLDRIAELNWLYDWLVNKQPADHEVVRKLGLEPGFKTLVFDGITAVQRKSFALVMGTEKIKPGDIPAKREWTHYGSVLENMLNIATAFFQTLEMNVLMSALQSADKRYRVPGDEASSYIYYDVALQGQSQEQLPGEALCVMRLAHNSQMDQALVKQFEKQGPKPFCIAQLTPSLQVYAKDQHNFGKQFIGDPTVTMLLDMLEAKERLS